LIKMFKLVKKEEKRGGGVRRGEGEEKESVDK
jgi:hypothetical protein